MADPDNKASPAHLEASELGSKAYWDALYAQELANHDGDADDTGTVWFAESGAERGHGLAAEEPEPEERSGQEQRPAAAAGQADGGRPGPRVRQRQPAPGAAARRLGGAASRRPTIPRRASTWRDG